MNTLTAHVYTTSPLEKSSRQAIADGLDLVGAHTGSIGITGTTVITLPDSAGMVYPDATDYRGCDPDTDLHLFVADFALPRTMGPLGTLHKALGISSRSSGVAWVKSGLDETQTRQTTSHEIAHALGYVLSDAPQGQDGHCNEESCIMNAKVELPIDLDGWSPDFLRNVFGIDVSLIPSAQDDFCGHCAAAIRDTAEDAPLVIKTNRSITDGVSMFVSAMRLSAFRASKR